MIFVPEKAEWPPREAVSPAAQPPLFVALRGNNGRLARKADFLGGKGRLAHAWKMAMPEDVIL